jgi:hypothetical protein
MKRVILETPFRGQDYLDTLKNLVYARVCMHDCLKRGESPFASHMIYTQPGVLDDTKDSERDFGIEAGFAWREVAEKTVVYIDRGISRGMCLGIRDAKKRGLELEFRELGYDWEKKYNEKIESIDPGIRNIWGML